MEDRGQKTEDGIQTPLAERNERRRKNVAQPPSAGDGRFATEVAEDTEIRKPQTNADGPNPASGRNQCV